MIPDLNPAAEDTAGRPDVLPCRFCQVPVTQPKRKDIRKDFCRDAHRAAFRDAQVQQAVREALAAGQEVRDVIEDAMGRLDQAAARMHGAMQLLARYQRHPRPQKKSDRK